MLDGLNKIHSQWRISRRSYRVHDKTIIVKNVGRYGHEITGGISMKGEHIHKQEWKLSSKNSIIGPSNHEEDFIY